MRPVGSWFPDQESNLRPCSGCTVLSAGPPGKSQIWSFNPKTISALALYLCPVLEPLLSPEQSPAFSSESRATGHSCRQEPCIGRRQLAHLPSPVPPHSPALPLWFPCSFHHCPRVLPQVLNAALACVPPWGWTANGNGARWTFARIWSSEKQPEETLK